MSYVVNAGVAPLCHSQDYPGSIPVPMVGIPAGVTPEDAFREPQLLLGSREATGARHCGVGGRDDDHLTSCPLRTVNQFPFDRADRRICRLSGHRRSSEELRPEILHGYELMACNDIACPHSGVVLGLSGRLLLQAGGLTPGFLISVRRSDTLLSTTPCHPSLCLCEFGGTALPMPEVHQVIPFVRRRRGGRHAPVDTDATPGIRGGWSRAADHKRRVLMSQGISVDAHRSRLRRQLPGPHHRNPYPFWQHQPTFENREAASRVLEGREAPVSCLVPRSSTIPHPKRGTQRLPVRAQHLLLRHLRTSTQPRAARACLGEQSRKRAESRPTPRSLLVDGLVPQEPTPMPLRDKRTLRRRARAQPVGVAHYFPHFQIVTRGTDMYRQPCRRDVRPDETGDFSGAAR